MEWNPQRLFRRARLWRRSFYCQMVKTQFQVSTNPKLIFKLRRDGSNSLMRHWAGRLAREGINEQSHAECCRSKEVSSAASNLTQNSQSKAF